MKGYPRSQFDIINNTSVSQIETVAAPNPTMVAMATYTSDKGTEDWELLYGLNGFTDRKGALNFSRHGQPQLTVAEILRNGGYVLGKRLVSKDAKLANTTVKAKVIKSDNVSYLYLYGVSADSCATLEDAVKVGYGSFDATADAVENEDKTKTEIDIPLFTVAPLGRGASNTYFKLIPEYYASKTNNFLKYSFTVMENAMDLESIMCTLNPDVVYDGINLSIQNKVNTSSEQVKVKIYEDGIAKLARVLAETATISGSAVSVADLVNMDFLNGLDSRGSVEIGGIVTKSTTNESSKTLWDTYKPADITTFYSIDEGAGIPITGGSVGTLGNSPITNMTEYEKLMLGAWGKDKESHEFDPAIYDLDNYKIDAIFDCAYPTAVKNAIIDLVDFRGDCVFLADLGTKAYTLTEIISAATEITSSKFVAVYHNFFNVIDPYTKKQIQVTLPYLLAHKLIAHITNGVGRPFAGIANNITFPEIVEGTVNFLPVVIPGADQKQQLVDANVNYISYYDGQAVMETMYTADDTYTQLSFLHNVMGVQEIIKLIRTRCPKTRYTFLDGDDLESYIDDAKAIINEYKTNFKSIEMTYMADEKYEANNIFYAMIKVQFKNFVQEEYFKIIAIN